MWFLLSKTLFYLPLLPFMHITKSFLFLVFCLLSVMAFSQSAALNGIVTDEQGKPLTGASVVLLKAADSTLIKGTATDINGYFELTENRPGFFLLRISFISYQNYFRYVRLQNPPLALGKISLIPNSNTLNQVTVTAEKATAQLKGDTTEYNADAVKTTKDASSEDLVGKLPGVTTTDGKVQAQGEEVKQVLVDGKPFFGNDPSTVLKNLPAEVVDKIQVFDKKSDQAAFSGVDDGNSTKTINIITKSQFRNGIFGKVYGGANEVSQYKTGVTLNFFKDKRRMTLLMQSNNINEQNFATEDLLGVMSSGGNQGPGGRPPGAFGGGMRGGRSGGGGQGNDVSNFLVDQRNGISTTHAAGLNYMNKWGKLDFTGSYFFNQTANVSTSNLLRHYITYPNENLAYTESGTARSTNINHRFNFRFDYRIDSMNSVLFQPRLSSQNNTGTNQLLGENAQLDTLLSRTNNDIETKLSGINFSAPVLYRHSFSKKGRTFSVSITPGYNTNTGNKYLKTVTGYFSDTLSSDTLNQLSNLDKKGFTFSSSVNYTEPITEWSQLQFSYTNTTNSSNSDKKTNNYSIAEQTYNRFDTSLSNKFSSSYQAHAGGVGYRYGKEKVMLNAGISVQYAQLKNDQQFPTDYVLHKTFTSVLPNAMYTYRFSAGKNLRINYRSSNNAPSVDQLQEVVNNTNPLQLSSGNARLKQTWENNLSMRYSAVNAVKSTAFFFLAAGTITQSYIGTQTIIASSDTLLPSGISLAKASQLTQPVNLNGYLNLRTFSSYSFPVKVIKCKLNLSASVNYSKAPGLINSQLNFTHNTSTTGGIVLSSNISEKIDFTLSSNTSLSFVKNTLQSNLNSKYLNQNSRAKITCVIWKGLVLQTDITDMIYTGLSSAYNQHYTLWGAAVGWKFLKDQSADLRLSVYDLLKQNRSITRNVTDTYYEDSYTTVLRQYFMLTFTYQIKYFKSKAQLPEKK